MIVKNFIEFINESIANNKTNRNLLFALEKAIDTKDWGNYVSIMMNIENSTLLIFKELGGFSSNAVSVNGRGFSPTIEYIVSIKPEYVELEEIADDSIRDSITLSNTGLIDHTMSADDIIQNKLLKGFEIIGTCQIEVEKIDLIHQVDPYSNSYTLNELGVPNQYIIEDIATALYDVINMEIFDNITLNYTELEQIIKDHIKKNGAHQL